MPIIFSSCADDPDPQIDIYLGKETLHVRGKTYRCGYSRYGIGNTPGSKKTPVGVMQVVKKMPMGDPHYHGRVHGDKMWLAGDSCPASRCIYIHTGELGTSSIGCIHLSQEDIREVYRISDVGTKVNIYR